MNLKKRIAGVLFFAAFAAGPSHAALSTETVTAVNLSTTTGLTSSIALDNLNTVHVLFYDPAAQRVKYTSLTNGSGVWASSQTVGNAAVAQSTGAMALDASRVPHVVYYDRTDNILKYTRLSGGIWLDLPNVDTFASTTPFISMTMGSDGFPRVLYSDEQSSSTKAAVYDGTAWSTYTVAGATLAASGGIALDSAGLIHAAFNAVDVSSHDLVYAVQSAPGASSFNVSTITVLGSTLTVAGNVSLAMDAGGNARISAFDEANQDLWYLKGTAATLLTSLSTISASGFVGRDSAIALTAAGLPVIAALDDGVGLDLFTFNGIAWSTTTLDADPFGGAAPSLLLNVYGHAFVAYYTSTTFAFATTAPRGLSIDGTAHDGAGAGLPGVTIALTGNVPAASVLTPGAGTFNFSNLFEGSYTVTPSRAGYGFLPAKRSLVPLSVSLSSQDFLGGPVNFSQVDNLIDPTQGQFVTMTYSILGGHILIEIYGLNGRLIRTLVDEDKTIGTYNVVWDGRNTKGDFVASGIYLVRVRAGGLKTVQKVAVVK